MFAFIVLCLCIGAIFFNIALAWMRRHGL